MKITICGAGVSGSYIASRMIAEGYKVRVYGPLFKRGHYCAYGCHYEMLKEKLRNVYLDADDYLLCRVRKVYVNNVCIDISDAIIIDKPRMLNDMFSTRNIYPRKIKKMKELSADLVINATSEPLSNEDVILMPTYQYKAELQEMERETAWVYFNPRYMGYAWVFPLDDEGKKFHVGAGCIGVSPLRLINEMNSFYGFKVKLPECGCARGIRIVNPESITLYEDKVVSVGEAAGAVHPLTGEGTLPSMDTCDMLLNALKNSDVSDNPMPYELNSLFSSYAIDWWVYMKKYKYDKAYEIVKFGMKHPRLAWIRGVGLFTKRAKVRSNPILGVGKFLKVISYLLK